MRPGTEKVPGSRAEGAREGGAIQGKKPGGAHFPDLGACASPGKGIGFRQPPGSSDVQSPGGRRVPPD